MTFTIRIRGGGGLIAREFLCLEHGIFDDTVPRDRRDEPVPCPACAAPSAPAISAPLGRMKLGEVSRGGVASAPSPIAFDTQPLADGMSYSDFKAKRRKIWNEHDRAKWKAKGLIR